MQTQDKPSADAQALVTSVTDEAPQQERWSLIVPWWKSFLAILPVFLITRVIFLLLTYFGVILFTLPNYSHQSLSLTTLIQAWYRWDANWYAGIAARGYTSTEAAAFFPL